MAEYDHFATTAANAGFPRWFCLLWSSALLVPLVKSGVNLVPDGADPDVRPVAVGETDLRASTSSMVADTAAEFASVLTPQQVAVGVQGGSSILVHGIRVTMEHHRDFVDVNIDLRYAYNAMRRRTALRRLRMASSGSFAWRHLASSGSFPLLAQLSRVLPAGWRTAHSSL
jgi:hypothetical protein